MTERSQMPEKSWNAKLPPYYVAWAKADKESGNWMPLIMHCQDAGAVAELYWDILLTPAVRGVVESWLASAGVENPEKLAKKLSCFLVSAHDVGKLSPAFSVQVDYLQQKMCALGFKYPHFNSAERRSTPHSAISQTAIREWLQKKFPVVSMQNIQSLACVAGGHHGNYQTMQTLNKAMPGLRGAGREPIWQKAREELLEVLQEIVGLSDKELEDLVTVGLNQPSQIILTGFTIICDWIASNADLFPYDLAAKLIHNTALERADIGLGNLNLPLPWQPEESTSDEELFASRFQLPANFSLRPIQRDMLDIVRKVERPTLIIVEAPTGEGKTELAFTACEILAQRFGYGGVFTALPTQATSNAMFSRMLSWLQKSVPESDFASVNLLHGKAQFNEEFTNLQNWTFTGIGESEADTLEAHWWLSGRKKAILADFVVGTIDQVLMASLVSKHVVLRMLGLAGKVIILDEIHAADEYMQVYLDGALRWLGALGIPVIALSATLPPARRAAMLRVYQEGRNDSPVEIESVCRKASNSSGYPLISLAEADVEPVISAPSGRRSEVHIEFCPENENFSVQQFISEICDGGCVAIIRNTVARAQKTYQELQTEFGEDVVLLHSRFLTNDRLKLEEKLVHLLGREGNRPKRLIVVATQVIEQSLDIDFDFMVSDLAPMDSLIQRMGRLHRHIRSKNTRPKNMQNPRFIITGFRENEQGVPIVDKGAARVYGEALLLRSLATVKEHLHSRDVIISPDDIAGLVRRAYVEDMPAPVGWEKIWQFAEQKRKAELVRLKSQAETGLVEKPKSGVQALNGWAQGIASDDEEVLSRSVRNIADSIEVVAVVKGPDGKIRTFDWLDEYANEEVDLENGLPAEFAKAIACCTVQLPGWLARGNLGDKVIEELEKDGIRSWQDSYWLKGMLPLVLNPDFTKDIGDYRIRYDKNIGFTVEKKEK